MNFMSGTLRRRFIIIDKEKIEGKDACERKPHERHNIKRFRYFHSTSDLKIFNLDSIVKVLYQPIWPSSLGVVRALFGLMMVIDIPDERGLASIDLRFGDPMRCHFPLFDGLSPLPLEYMGLLYSIMWLGSLGICLGFKYKISCLMFIIPYWYIYLLDKSLWNNHSYLYGLVSILFAFTSANNSFSLDALLNPSIRNKAIPLWNYAIIRFQFFLLYFYAGVKKLDPDWIGGYSMPRLGLHWVFQPFRLLLNNDQIDFWIIHIFGFFFDLTVGFFLLINKTRPVAIMFATAFHLMNSCMFHIGQFPYVCLVTTPIFCSYNWPEQLLRFLGKNINNGSDSSPQFSISKDKKEFGMVTRKRKLVCFTMAIYIAIQLFLPYSHFLTQGYNNWTEGLYGYSWDMMVQNWKSHVIVVKLIDNRSREEFFIDPEAWVENTRYSKHGDMLIQYAKCLKRNLNSPWISKYVNDIHDRSFDNISIHVDVWCSLNGRFQQRMFNPSQDLLTAEWSPFDRISWLLPLLSDFSSWRQNLYSLQKEVYSWSNYSEVLFVADFPGLHLENYIDSECTNVTVTVLQGIIVLEQESFTKKSKLANVTLFKGDSSKIIEGNFHKIYTVSEEPSCYMYIYNNFSTGKLNIQDSEDSGLSSTITSDALLKNLFIRVENFFSSLIRLRECFNKLLFDVPIPVRVKKVQ